MNSRKRQQEDLNKRPEDEYRPVKPHQGARGETKPAKATAAATPPAPADQPVSLLLGTFSEAAVFDDGLPVPYLAEGDR
ncbi:hypothetical protein LTR08_008081 [Meristemomyces frigidus]|nr:hypothetical protein LTR08_008081 [Meristemomyces frigidus]